MSSYLPYVMACKNDPMSPLEAFVLARNMPTEDERREMTLSLLLLLYCSITSWRVSKL